MMPVRLTVTFDTAASRARITARRLLRKQPPERDQQILSAERPAILAPFGHRPIDQDGVRPGLRGRRRRSRLVPRERSASGSCAL